MKRSEDYMDQVALEASRAGCSAKVQQLLDTLEFRRITPDKQLPEMEFLFRLFGKPCFPRGELVGITGKAKSGKTFVTSMLMVTALTQECLALERHTDSTDLKPLRVMWFDTEQSEESTQDILKNRMAAMVGGKLPMHLLDVFNVRADFWQERMPLLEAAIMEFLPDLVVLDGIRDLVNDINDGVMAQEIIERLMHLAQDTHCCIVCVLHQNKSVEDRNLRGWIGTELMNKAFEVYACEKDADRIFSVEQTHTRKYDILDTMRFIVGEDGIPVLTNSTQNTETRKTMNGRYVIHHDNGEWEHDLKLLFGDALKSCTRGHEDLMNWLRDKAGLNQIQYRSRLITTAVGQRIIQKGHDSAGHVVYTLPSHQQSDFWSEMNGAPR